MNFKELNLRDQIKNVEGLWYYENIKDKLKVYKHSVIFDKDFRFELSYRPEERAKKTEDIIMQKDIIIDGIKEMSKGDVIHIEKGEVICDEYITLSLILDDVMNDTIGWYNDDKYSDKTDDILDFICIYINDYI